ncbi:hypothetical protein NHX12_019371 [Muraenolepis orangiensis]|uniref:Uncharacterized protein n=1 Tax=Muraenolepis orangiensis TaxID=630683 RepID=A0A9Q0IVZ5_9TELE|nr:hypothetical protein NHX12_019371 [Muraenolepis orangiensis]
MSKKMKKLEKECMTWKSRFDGCNKALLDMLADKTVKDKELEMFTTKNQKLESLCRALQEERKTLAQKVQEAGGPAPVVDPPKPEEKEEEPKEPVVAPAPFSVVAPTPTAPPTTEAPSPSASSATAPPPAPPTSSPAVQSPLVKELASLKAEQARLQEISSSFTISHVIPEELLYQDMEEYPSHGLSEVTSDPAEEDRSEGCDRAQGVAAAEQKAVEVDGAQELLDLEMESVD